MTPIGLHALALVAYICASVYYGANLNLKDPRHAVSARALFAVGIGLHTAAIGLFCVQAKQSPFASYFGMLSVASWFISLLTLPAEKLGRVKALGLLAAPASSILLFAALMRPRIPEIAAPEISHRIVSIHVLMVVFSFALFTLAACCAVFYIWQYHVLKRPDRRAIFRKLPPLETVDAMAFKMVAFAQPLLTLGLVLGIVRAMDAGSYGAWLRDLHVLLSLVAWAVFGGYIFLHSVAGVRGTRPNYLLISGLLVTLVLYFLPSSTHKLN